MPERIHRFDIIGPIGEGSFGIVYHAFDPSIKRHVALKLLKLDRIGDAQRRQQFKEMFYQEARIAGNLIHPNIAIIYDVNETEDGTPFIAMEYVEGRTLAELLQSGPPLRYVHLLKIIHKLGQALHYAHQYGVVHCDLKPSNIRVTSDYEPKILDFGFARWLGSLSSMVGIQGTPLYMAPEQIRGQEPTPMTDLYALGIILWQLILGNHPFAGQTLQQIIHRILSEPPGPVDEGLLREAGISPKEWKAFFRHCLSKIPGERFESATELVRQLERLLTVSPKLETLKFPLALPATLQVASSATPTPRTAAPRQTGRPSRAARAWAGGTLTAVFSKIFRRPRVRLPFPSLTWVLTGLLVLAGLLVGGILAWLMGTAPQTTASASSVTTWSSFLPGGREPSLLPEPASGVLVHIRSKPKAVVVWDDHLLGTTPQDLTGVEPGPHRLELRAANYEPLQAWVVIPPQAESWTLQYQLLQPVYGLRYGSLIVASEPTGADVFLDGKHRGTTPVLIEKVSRGSHRVMVKQAGFQTHERVIYVERGRAHTVTFMLEPELTPPEVATTREGPPGQDR